MNKKIVMKNLNCIDCANQIEESIKKLLYIDDCTFNFANETMNLTLNHPIHNQTLINDLQTIANRYEDDITVSNKDTNTPSHPSFYKKYTILVIGLIIFFIAFMLDYFTVYPFITQGLMWLGYILIAHKIIKKTWLGLRQKALFNENLLMFTATFAAMLIDKPYEAIAVVLFYSVGEYLQDRALNHSKKEISSLIDLHVNQATLVNRDGSLKVIDPKDVKVGDILRVKKGEKVPVDGSVIKGNTTLNTSILTGESKPQKVEIGDSVLSGTINTLNVIEIEAQKPYASSSVKKIIDLIENAPSKKAKTEQFITSFAKYYTPVVVFLALLIAVIPSLLYPENRSDYILRAATFLVISCPCALVLSIPLSYFASIGKSAKHGILFKGADALDKMNHVDFIGFDKTGTLTNGTFEVSEYSSKEALDIAAMVENYSTHPIAKSIKAYHPPSNEVLSNVKEHAGLGLSANHHQDFYLVGNQKLFDQYDIKTPPLNTAKTTIHVAKNNEYIGYICISDTLKASAYETIQTLAQNKKLIMLTGDNAYVAKDIAKSLGNIYYFDTLLPEDKINAFNESTLQKYSMYVGDGINDAPLIKNADIGVAMSDGSDIALEVADVIITTEHLHTITYAFDIAKKTRAIVWQNIFLTLGVKFSFLALATFGLTTMWMAIFADVGITLIAVMNALRLLYGRMNTNETKSVKTYA